MGQQQLILLVLGIVIVAFAVLAGLETYSRARTEAEFDAMTQVAYDVVADLDRWYSKPTVFGGGGRAVCPFTPSPEVYGRMLVSGEPFPAAAPRYPSPGAGTWIDAGNGLYAQLDAPNDIVRVVSRTHGALSVELQAHGPAPACLAFRRRTYRAGAGVLDAPHVALAACPRPWE